MLFHLLTFPNRILDFMYRQSQHRILHSWKALASCIDGHHQAYLVVTSFSRALATKTYSSLATNIAFPLTFFKFTIVNNSIRWAWIGVTMKSGHYCNACLPKCSHPKCITWVCINLVHFVYSSNYVELCIMYSCEHKCEPTEFIDSKKIC